MTQYYISLPTNLIYFSEILLVHYILGFQKNLSLLAAILQIYILEFTN